MSLHPLQQRPSFQNQYAPPAFHPPHHEKPIPPRNEVELTPEMLIDVLTYFSLALAKPFGRRPIRLVVHGGACMLLHPGLYSLSQQQMQLSPTMPRRKTTRDVDIIKRSFALEWAQFGLTDATDRLEECVRATARRFGLGADWMNSDADVALPWATDPSGQTYDPIYAAAIQSNNVALHTIFKSQNGLLTLISVTPFWSVALKLVRYTKWDPGDICLLLRNGTILSKTQWTPEMLENWLFMHCWAMGYAHYDAQRRNDMRLRIVDAVQLVANWTAQVIGYDSVPVTPVEAMGGGDVFPGSQGQPGWNSRTGAWPIDKHHRKSSVVNDHRITGNQNKSPASGSNLQEWLDEQRDRQSDPHSGGPKRRRSRPEEMFIPPDIEPSTMNFDINLNGQKKNDSPPLDERWTLINPPDLRSRPKSSNAISSWQELHRARSSEELVTSLEQMLDTRQAPWPGGFIHPNAKPVIPLTGHSKSHRKSKKKDKARDRDHISQWARRDVASDESSTDEEPSSRRTLPVWQIYSDKPTDGAPQTQSFLVQQPRIPTSSPPPFSRAPQLSFSQSQHSQLPWQYAYDPTHSHIPASNLLGLYSS